MSEKWLGKDVEGSSHCLTVGPSRHLLWETEQGKTSQSHQLVSGAGFEPGISQIQCRSAIHSSVTFSVTVSLSNLLICHGYCYRHKEILWKLCVLSMKLMWSHKLLCAHLIGTPICATLNLDQTELQAQEYLCYLRGLHHWFSHSIRHVLHRPRVEV